MKREAWSGLGVALLTLGLIGCEPTMEDAGPSSVSFVLPEIEAEPGSLFRGTFSPDGRAFYYFVKVSSGEDYRVHRTVMTDSGWGLPELLSLGDSTASTMYPAISPDGSELVFSSYRPINGEPATNANLWRARLLDSGWGEPELLTEVSTPDNYDASPRFSSDGTLHFWSSSPDWSTTSARRAVRRGGGYAPWEADSFWDDMEWPRDTHFFWSGVVSPNGTVAVAEISSRREDGSLGDSDLWVSRLVYGDWTPLEPLGGDVNSDAVENFPLFAPDGETLIWVRDFTSFHSIRLSPFVDGELE